MNDHNLGATVFVYRHKPTGKIKAVYLDQAMKFYRKSEYEHLATIEPSLWIQAHYEKIMQSEEK